MWSKSARQSCPYGACMTLDVIKAVFLGIVEGLTEFIPVSSTGHLLLVGHFFGFDDESFGKSFDVLIQLGAILALLSIYFSRLWRLFLGMFSNRDDQRFAIGVLVAFLLAMPTMVGAFAFEAFKNRAEFSGGNMLIIAVGFAVSFVCGWFVVKTLL